MKNIAYRGVLCLFDVVVYSAVIFATEVVPEKVWVPSIKGEYIHIHEPQGDVFPGPTRGDLVAGQFYPSWQPNDHCFLKGPDHLWHSFGITHPTTLPGQDRHQGENLSYHAVSSADTFKDSFGHHLWKDKPKVLSPNERPGEIEANHAPYIIKDGELYKMIYGPTPFRMATSKDLYNWTLNGNIACADKAKGRDPSIMLWKGIYYLIYCDWNSVKVTTTKDFQNWTEPVTIFRPENEKHDPESPSIIPYQGKFYLFWCLWDKTIKGNGYGERTFVYCSDDPFNFSGKALVSELRAHAPEIFQGEDEQWYISSAQYPNRGINIAKLEWK